MEEVDDKILNMIMDGVEGSGGDGEELKRRVVSPQRKNVRGEDEEEEGVAGSKKYKTGYKVEVELSRVLDGGGTDGLTAKLVQEIVKEGESGFDSALVPYESERNDAAIVSVKGGLGKCAVGWGLSLEGVTLPTKKMNFNPMMGQLFGDLFAKMEIDSVNGLDYWLTPSMETGSAGFMPSTSPGNMVCSFVPCKKNDPSPFFNKYNQEEFIDCGENHWEYNDRFWTSEYVWKYMKNGKKLAILDCAAMIPEFVLRDEDLAKHREALKWHHEHGCGLGGTGKFVKCSFFGPYVFVMMAFLTSPVVKMARIYGFYPLFLVKNVLLQKTQFGVNGMQFVSVDTQARTNVMLCGFWRMKFNNRNKLEVVAVKADGTLLSHGMAASVSI
jgi:hypothetical protein